MSAAVHRAASENSILLVSSCFLVVSLGINSTISYHNSRVDYDKVVVVVVFCLLGL